MNQIKDPPPNSDFGYDFNYALWTEGTRVALMNVNWNNDYRDCVKFEDRTALNTHLTTLENALYTFDDLAYVKAGEPIRIDLPFNAVYRFNYLRASNPAQPVNGDTPRDFYYFIIDVRYVAPNTTEIVVQLDVWQTFIYDVTFGNSYIERGHIGIANENAFDHYGRDYLTIPEGLDVGSEYQIVTKRSIPIMSVTYDTHNDPPLDDFNVLAVSTVDLTADAGTASAPVLVTAEGGVFGGIPSGASYYVWASGGSFASWMSANQDKPWVTQGIISITAIPPIQRYIPGFDFESGGDPTPFPSSGLNPVKHALFPNWRDSDEIENHIPERYRHIAKFKTSPYMMVELTTFSATPIGIKPEIWNDEDANVIERISVASAGQRVAFNPYRYNSPDDAVTEHFYPGYEDYLPWVEGGDDGGEWIDYATILANFPTIMIVNNSGIAYIAANRNGLTFGQQSAGWQQQRALRGNEVAYDQATGAMEAGRTLTDIGNTADYASTMLGNANNFQNANVQMLGSGIGGASQGAISGSVAGPAGAAIGAGIQAVGSTIGSVFNSMTVGNNAETAARAQSIRAAAATANNNVQNKQAGMVRDTNRSLSDWAARGDYENTIAGINAKVQDAQLIQPTTSGQLGGDALNLVNNSVFLSMRVKMIDKAAMAVIGEYWLRYGIAVRRFATIPQDLMVMTKFTYWKLLETYITSAMMPEGFKQAIRGILEKGVTVWANPADIGNIDLADNEIIGGITL